MRTRFWKAILSFIVLLVVHGCSSSDGGGGGGGITPTEVTGVVVQGPVDGATVFADSLITGTKFVLDEGEVYTQTDANGEYTLPEVPYDSYQIVAVGGTDTLTQQPGVLMCAPEGITTITPMTTLVAMDPTLKAKIESNMHLAFDTNHATTAVGCSTIALAKASEIAVAAVVQSIEKAFVDGAIALTPEQLQQVKAQIMSIVLTAIAEEFRLGVDPAYVTDIEDVIWSALEKALVAINAAYPGVIVTDPAGMASAIVNLIDVCLGQTNDGDAADGDLNDDINEVDFISINGLQTLIQTELENAVITISPTIQVTAPSPEATLLLPVVNSCTPADESVDVDVEEAIVINFNKPLNQETLTTDTITVKDAAGNLIPITITYDETEGFVVKIRPIEAWPYETVLSVTITPAVTDVVATPLPLPVTSNLTTVPAVQPPPPPPPIGDPVAGQAIYDSYCAGCHRLGAYDTTGFAPDLAGKTVTSLPSGHPAVPTSPADLVNVQAFVNTI